jgi:hypothetical protein
MPAPLSRDLRERIVEAVESGSSMRGAAARFAVSPSSAIKLMARVRATGGVAPAPRQSPLPFQASATQKRRSSGIVRGSCPGWASRSDSDCRSASGRISAGSVGCQAPASSGGGVMMAARSRSVTQAANFSRNWIVTRLATSYIYAVAPSAKILVPPPDHGSYMASPRPMGRRSGR